MLEAHGARVAVDDAVALEALTVTTHGDRVLCAGDAGPLFAALTGVPLVARGAREADEPPGEARVVGGTLLLAGRDVARGAHRPIAGAAPLDPPLPPAWTAEAYVTWSARLAGARPRAAREMAHAALARVGLGGASRKRALQTLAPPERRALVLAHAAATSPRVLVVEDPLSGLDGPAAAFVLDALAAVTADRAALVSTSRLDPSSPDGVLLRGATHVVVLSGGELVFEGGLPELAHGGRVYALTVRSNAGAFGEELAARGITLRGGPVRFSAALPPGSSTRDLVAAAVRARAPVTEMVPLV